MTLQELSGGYIQQAVLLGERIRALQGLAVTGEERYRHLERLKLLEDMRRDCRAIGGITARYYERGFDKRGKYAL